MSAGNLKHIQLLKTILNNDEGDVLEVTHETESAVYFEDGEERTCFFYKNEEGVDFVFVTSPHVDWEEPWNAG